VSTSLSDKQYEAAYRLRNVDYFFCVIFIGVNGFPISPKLLSNGKLIAIILEGDTLTAGSANVDTKADFVITS